MKGHDTMGKDLKGKNSEKGCHKEKMANILEDLWIDLVNGHKFMALH